MSITVRSDKWSDYLS